MYQQTKSKLIREASIKNIPIMGEFELTAYCNLKCKMCYVQNASKRKEKTTEEWLSLISKAKEAGLLFCLFTGGEIFLRDDFITIYEATYDMGIRISLFTNATLITDDIIASLKKRPPESIAVTMYGASNATYEAITGIKNGFDLFKQGVLKLKENNIYTIIRTIAIKEIYLELNRFIAFVKEHGFFANYYLYVGPSRDEANVCNPKLMRLSPSELVNYKMRLDQAFGLSHPIAYSECDEGFKCVAGSSAYFITWDHRMIPCAMLPVPSELVEEDFLKAWVIFSKKTKSIPLCQGYDTCGYKSTCMQCPARRYLEQGFDQCSPYLKEIAKRFSEVDHEDL